MDSRFVSNRDRSDHRLRLSLSPSHFSQSTTPQPARCQLTAQTSFGDIIRLLSSLTCSLLGLVTFAPSAIHSLQPASLEPNTQLLSPHCSSRASRELFTVPFGLVSESRFSEKRLPARRPPWGLCATSYNDPVPASPHRAAEYASTCIGVVKKSSNRLRHRPTGKHTSERPFYNQSTCRRLLRCSPNTKGFRPPAPHTLITTLPHPHPSLGSHRSGCVKKMDDTRGRSPSRGNAHHISPQPSPNQFQASVPGVDPAVQQALTSGKFNTSQSYNYPFLDSQQQGVIQSNPTDPSFYGSNQYPAFSDNQFGGPTFDPSFSDNNFLYQDENMPNDFNQNYTLDSTYDMDPQTNINPAELSKVSSPQDGQSPSLFPPETHSQPGSPASTNGQFYTPQHSRHASLDPSSAYGETFSGTNFQQHRRAPSDHSEISSAAHSPFLAHSDMHENSDLNHSPYLAAQSDTNNAFGMESFSLGEQASYRSPRLMPHMEAGQQGLGLNQDMTLNQPMGIPIPDVYTTQPSAYPSLIPSNHMRNTSVVSDIGQADQFAPPTINIEPAPVSRQQSFGPQGEAMEGALSPPSSNSMCTLCMGIRLIS